MTTEYPRTFSQEDIVSGIDQWLGKTRGGYDFWKIGKLVAAADTANFFAENMLAVQLYKSRASFHKAIFPKRKIPGLILEFGVAGGKSINKIAEIYAHEQVYGFDSFEGLPEAWRSDYQKGHFAQSLPPVKENVELIVGWFNKTLPPFLQAHNGNISLLHVDCDLYSSTKTIFDLLADRITSGTLIVFDEYFNYPGWREHEHKAFMEFIESNGLRYKYVGAVRSNKQVAVMIE